MHVLCFFKIDRICITNKIQVLMDNGTHGDTL